MSVFMFTLSKKAYSVKLPCLPASAIDTSLPLPVFGFFCRKRNESV